MQKTFAPIIIGFDRASEEGDENCLTLHVDGKIHVIPDPFARPMIAHLDELTRADLVPEDITAALHRLYGLASTNRPKSVSEIKNSREDWVTICRFLEQKSPPAPSDPLVDVLAEALEFLAEAYSHPDLHEIKDAGGSIFQTPERHVVLINARAALAQYNAWVKK